MKTFDELFNEAYQHLDEAFRIYCSMADCFEYEGPADEDEDDTSTVPLYLCDNFQDTYNSIGTALRDAADMWGDWQRHAGISDQEK